MHACADTSSTCARSAWATACRRATDLFYVGGGQDREQALVADDLVEKAGPLREAAEAGAAFLAVCGGYQLLGRFYRDVAGAELPGIGLLPLHTIAGQRRMIGDVLLDCGWADRTMAGFENHAGRTILDDGAEPLGRVISGFGNDGVSGAEGCRWRRVYGRTCTARCSREPLVRRSHPGRGPRPRRRADGLAPLPDELETEAHRVSADRARTRGGRY